VSSIETERQRKTAASDKQFDGQNAEHGAKNAVQL
jgi:hypothetical protein